MYFTLYFITVSIIVIWFYLDYIESIRCTMPEQYIFYDIAWFKKNFIAKPLLHKIFSSRWYTLNCGNYILLFPKNHVLEGYIISSKAGVSRTQG